MTDDKMSGGTGIKQMLHTDPRPDLSHWMEAITRLLIQTNEEIKLLRKAVHRYGSNALQGIDITTDVDENGCNCRYHLNQTDSGAWECPLDGNVERP